MRKLFLILPAVILTAACGSRTNVINKPSYDYSRYPTPVTEVTPAAPQTGDDSQDFTGESRFGAKSTYGDAVVTVGSKKFPIGPNAGQKEMNNFQASLDRAYKTAKKTYSPDGFTYSISPAGAVNPLSDMEVQCILSQESADNVGQQTCDLFFKSLKSDYSSSSGAALNAAP